MLRNPRIAAITALVLCLPIVIILSLITLDVESDIVRQDRVLNGGVSRLGSVISLGAILLLPVASVICLMPVVKGGGTHRTIAQNSPNLLLTIPILLLFLSTWVPSWLTSFHVGLVSLTATSAGSCT